MGIGLLGAPNIIIKRKFRWMLAFITRCGTVGPHFVKTAARPQIDIDEVEMHYRNAVTWIPGKARWQPITVTYVDAVHDELQGVYSWLASLYNFNDRVNLPMTEKPGWAGVAELTLFDGCGGPLETWTLMNCWPQSVNFGDLDYANSEECTVEMTLRYSDVHYNSHCGRDLQPCCVGCGTDLSRLPNWIGV